MKTLSKAMAAMAFAAALSFVSHASAAPACRLFSDARFGGGYFDIPANTKVRDFTKVYFWGWGEKCEPVNPARVDDLRRANRPIPAKCTKVWIPTNIADNGGLVRAGSCRMWARHS